MRNKNGHTRRNLQRPVIVNEVNGMQTIAELIRHDSKIDFPFEFRWLPLSVLNVDRQAYQRNLDVRWSNKLKREYNPLFLEVLIVNERVDDGRYFVVNGQHRYEMLRSMYGENHLIPCMVSNVDQATERSMFLSQKEQKSLRRIDQAHAQPDGPGERCIIAAMAKYGAVPDFVGRYTTTDEFIQPTGGLLNAYKRIPNAQDAEDILTTSIDTLLTVYPDTRIQDNFFEGLCFFLQRYRYAYHADILKRALASTSMADLKSMRDDFGNLFKSYRDRAAAAIVQVYNLEANRVNPMAMLPDWK